MVLPKGNVNYQRLIISINDDNKLIVEVSEGESM